MRLTGPPALPAIVAAVVAALFGLPSPALAAEKPAMASASWHGRAIQDPKPRPRIPRAGWPVGWSAGAVGPGSGYVRPGGSDRVRDVQRRLVRLGYRPGPVDGLFGPRTRAAVRWFQYKHGLATRGRVNRATLAVLHARSDHEPLRDRTRPAPRTTTPNDPVAPTRAPRPAAEGDDRTVLAVSVLLLLLALALGVVTGLRGPNLLRAFETEPTATCVLGYATSDPDHRAIAARCADRNWALVEVVDDNLEHALRELRTGTASGLVVARLRDVAPGIADLATLVHVLEEANAFLAAADHDLDTSTDQGRATARAIVELGAWERRARGRFAPADSDLAEEIVAMLDRGIPPRAVSDALVLAGFAGEARTRTEEGRRM